MARRKRFSAEFKRQALRRANEPGMTDTLVCEEIGGNWIRPLLWYYTWLDIAGRNRERDDSCSRASRNG